MVRFSRINRIASPAVPEDEGRCIFFNVVIWFKDFKNTRINSKTKKLVIFIMQFCPVVPFSVGPNVLFSTLLLNITF